MGEEPIPTNAQRHPVHANANQWTVERDDVRNLPPLLKQTLNEGEPQRPANLDHNIIRAALTVASRSLGRELAHSS